MTFTPPPSLTLSGKTVLPIVEGGKGIGATNGESAGAFAAAGAVGTFSGVNANRYDEHGAIIPPVYHGKTRKDRHEELVHMGIEGGLVQARTAHKIAQGKGRIHMNILWEMGGAERVAHGILAEAQGMVHGITCGAGMPYRLAELAAQYEVYYHPIVSSMRAFRALWKRSYSKVPKWLGSVVYEDPWLAGGHNGLSNSEDPTVPEDPFPRVAELREFMRSVGLDETPIIMAGGVWCLQDWQHWIENDAIGPIAFQFGSRPLLTRESPIPPVWKERLLALKEGDVYLNRFSPTGFYSSAVENDFLRVLKGREERQMPYATEQEGYLSEPLPVGARGRPVYISPDDMARAQAYIADGFDTPMKTPDATLMFVGKEEAASIHKDQVDCMGCLSHCRFSNWKDHDNFTTGKKADPRSFCIQKSLQNIIQGHSVDDNLMFAGHNAYHFKDDPLYANGHVPSVAELIDCLMQGR